MGPGPRLTTPRHVILFINVQVHFQSNRSSPQTLSIPQSTNLSSTCISPFSLFELSLFSPTLPIWASWLQFPLLRLVTEPGFAVCLFHTFPLGKLLPFLLRPGNSRIEHSTERSCFLLHRECVTSDPGSGRMSYLGKWVCACLAKDMSISQLFPVCQAPFPVPHAHQHI